MKLPSLEVLDRLASALGVGLKDLLNFDTGPYRTKPISRNVIELAAKIQAMEPDRRRLTMNVLRVLLK